MSKTIIKTKKLQQTKIPLSGDERWKVFGICLFIAVVVWIVFGQTIHHDFVNYDDDLYVYRNLKVTHDLTSSGIVWMFTHFECNFYHPLTMLSLMLDHNFHGLNPGGYHLTSVLLHAASAILLFLAFHQMTAAPWRSAVVATLFAIHPLNAESVAWVAERKEVLAGFFFILTLLLYARYVRSVSRFWYFASAFSFVLGLMSKPSVVTLPFVLLLLDYWPLGRFQFADLSSTLKGLRPLIIEKIPFFVLSVIASVLAIFAQAEGVITTESLSLPARVSNALVSYFIYLRQLVFPVELVPFYPHPENSLPLWKPILALALLVCVSLGMLLWRKKHPFFLTGWLWFLGVLVPMIGIVQVGSLFAHADRFMYLPQIGFYLLAVWGVAALSASWRNRQMICSIAAVILFMTLIACARTQTAHWQNSETLWRHTLACTTNNALAHTDLGFSLLQAGQVEEASNHFAQAIEIEPRDAISHKGLGVVFFSIGQEKEAIAHFQKAVEYDSGYAQGHYNLGLALLKTRQLDEAILHFTEALEIEPDYMSAHNSLGAALVQAGRTREAISHFEAAVKIQPDFVPANVNLAWVLATCSDASLRKGQKAVELAERAKRLSESKDLEIEQTLAAAYAENGNFTQAIATAQQALQLAEDGNNAALAKALQKQLDSYQANTPFRE